jgi:addiction module HigA family antidote
MSMRNPPHPGGIVRRQCLKPLGLTVTEAAKGLGVTRQALSELVNERAGISVDMAIRLSKSLRLEPGDVARHADGLRPVAGARPRSHDRRAPVRRRLTFTRIFRH